MADPDPEPLTPGRWVRTVGSHTWLDNDLAHVHRFADGTLGRIEAVDERHFTVAVVLADQTIRAFSWIISASVAPATPTEEEFDRWAIAALSR